MGRRRTRTSGGGLLVLIALAILVPVFGFIAENIGAFLVIGGIVLVGWIIYKANSSPAPTAPQQQRPTPVSSAAWHTRRSEPTARPTSTNGDDFWKPAGTDVELTGHQLGSMLYVGKGLASIGDGHQLEPALIDPDLPVARGITECTTRRTPYWPSYSTIGPDARAAYLLWLQTGRKDPSADLGYVFLFFYGLERRALFDACTSTTAASEIDAIEGEVTRLLKIYGGQRSFDKYAGAFLDFLAAKRLPHRLYTTAPDGPTGRALTFRQRLALAQCVADGEALPPAWAHFWVTSHGVANLRTAVRRCPKEFKALFEGRYQARFGKGLVIPRNRTRLKLEYRPATASFRGAYYANERDNPLILDLDLPDVSVLASPVKKLQEIADEACADLEGYSRIIGKNPSAASSFEAFVELPLALWPEQYRKPLESVRDVVQRTGTPAAIPLEKFRSWLPEITDLTRAKFRALANALAGASIGMEPDVRFGGSVPALDSRVVLFADDPDTRAPEPSPRYAAAALTLHLATAVIAADGDVAEAEKTVLRRQLEEWLHLTESERRRLNAHLRFLLTHPPKLSGLKTRIESLDRASREALGDFLAIVAQADDQVTPQEIRTLQKIFKLLGLDPQSVFSKVHVAAITAATEPIALAPDNRSHESGMTGAGGYAIPRPPAPPARSPTPPMAGRSPSTTFKLDHDKVAALQKDSERVAAILASVFQEPSPPDAADELAAAAAPCDIDTDDAGADAEPTLLNLDPVHSALLEILITRTHWTRADLEELAADRDLMLDGALEHINEASFEILDMAIIEDGDPLTLNADAIREMTRDEEPATA